MVHFTYFMVTDEQMNILYMCLNIKKKNDGFITLLDRRVAFLKRSFFEVR